MVRLTQDILERAPQITNPLGERELDLRGNGITLLDDAPLALLRDSFDVLDLTDNSLHSLESFPRMERLATIIAHKNKLSRLALSAVGNTPNVHSFVADDNMFSSLESLIALGSWKQLERVSLQGSLNTVALNEDFRAFLVYLCPKLKLINFQRVLQVEKDAAVAKKASFEALVRSAGGAASLAMTLGVDQRRARRRGKTRRTGSPVKEGEENSTVGTHAAMPDDVFEKKSQELEERLLAAETEEEVMAIQEEMLALENARKRK